MITLFTLLAGAVTTMSVVLVFLGAAYFSPRVALSTVGFVAISRAQFRKELAFALMCGTAVLLIMLLIYFVGSGGFAYGSGAND